MGKCKCLVSYIQKIVESLPYSDDVRIHHKWQWTKWFDCDEVPKSTDTDIYIIKKKFGHTKRQFKCLVRAYDTTNAYDNVGRKYQSKRLLWESWMPCDEVPHDTEETGLPGSYRSHQTTYEVVERREVSYNPCKK